MRVWERKRVWVWNGRMMGWWMTKVVMMTLVRWDDRGEGMNQEEADQDWLTKWVRKLIRAVRWRCNKQTWRRRYRTRWLECRSSWETWECWRCDCCHRASHRHQTSRNWWTSKDIITTSTTSNINIAVLHASDQGHEKNEINSFCEICRRHQRTLSPWGMNSSSSFPIMHKPSELRMSCVKWC